MHHTFAGWRTASAFLVALAATVVVGSSSLQAQRRGGPPPGPPPTAQASAPIDVTGYWEAIITEDWRWRMVTPPRGDYQSVTLNDAARKVADAWDPDKDTAAGLQCKAYGMPAVMRIPGRIHITWKDPSTLQIDLEAGTQTRLLHFGDAPAPAGDQGWQGWSVAKWDVPEVPGGRQARGRTGTNAKVVTTHIRPGYLRKNGVPYSANATVTEYFNVLAGPKEPDNATWLLVANFVDDPQFLTQPFATSTHFRKLTDEQGKAQWSPEACNAK